MNNNNLEIVWFLLYKNVNTDISINVIISDNTIWATQKLITSLFGKSVKTINSHLREMYETKLKNYLKLQLSENLR